MYPRSQLLIALGLSAVVFTVQSQAKEANAVAGVWQPDSVYVCMRKRNSAGELTSSKCLVESAFAEQMRKNNDQPPELVRLENCIAESSRQSMKVCMVKDAGTKSARLSRSSKIHIPRRCFDERVMFKTKKRDHRQVLVDSSVQGIKAISDLEKCPEAKSAHDENDESVEAEDPTEALKRKQVEEQTCAEPEMNLICECGHKSRWVARGKQCSRCFDKFKWGYGCDLDCPKQCTRGCHHQGNCIHDDLKPANCKRNGRVPNPTDKANALNSRGECQACTKGFHGLLCEESCPSNCGLSVEGNCTRAGKCFNCKPTYFGETCDRKCPKGCPTDCLMEDGEVDGERMPAGSCMQACVGNKWGPSCNDDCPAGCAPSAKQGKASCSRGEGICHQCPQGFSGPKCDIPCGHCADGACKQDTGHCKKGVGCATGYWGVDKCTKTCPPGSVGGCDRENGKPEKCEAKKFPALGGEHNQGLCQDCPSTCHDQLCNQKGKCDAGCVEGFHGKRCEKECPKQCVGGCDQISGQCKACQDKFTGPFCAESCHSRCDTCRQFADGGKIGALLTGAHAGNGPDDCLSCHKNEPAEFIAGAKGAGSCECLSPDVGTKAIRNQDTDKCVCHDDLNEESREAFFDSIHGVCHTKCKLQYREAKVEATGETTCLRVKIFNGMILADGLGTLDAKKGAEPCGADQYNIDGECVEAKWKDAILTV